jgi:heat shock protein HslJ/uncharacterized lipoprotein YbaY
MTHHRIRVGLLAVAVGLAGAPGLAQTEVRRNVTGSLTYLARIALPPDAEIRVTVRDLTGRTTGALNQPSGGGQVPLPFTFAVDGAEPGALTAGILIDGRMAWTSAPVVVLPGQGDVDVGAVRVQIHQPMGFVSGLRCGDLHLRLGFLGEIARLRVAGRTIDLTQVEAASGSRFRSADGQTEVWTHRDEARVRLDGAEVEHCAIFDAEPPQTLRAWGAGPDWDLAAGGGLIRFRNAEMIHLIPMPEAQAAPGGGWRLESSMAVAPFTLTLQPEACAGAVMGIEMPYRAEVTLGDASWTGCAGPMGTALALGDWRVEELGGVPVSGAVEVSMVFVPEDGRVMGRSGCNRFVGRFATDGAQIAFGGIATTMMACEPAAMDIELRFGEALQQADRVAVSSDGLLTLERDGIVLLRARR